MYTKMTKVALLHITESLVIPNLIALFLSPKLSNLQVQSTPMKHRNSELEKL